VPTWAELQPQLEQVRQHGISRSEGEVLPGIHAMAAPVFDHRGAIALSLTAIGPATLFDTAWDGEVARVLREGAAQVSARLGAPRGVAAPQWP
jgi:DNA-binding IclR family transcriptional regulator